MDKIHIKGLRVYAYHGVNPEEKEKGQPFEMDITLHTNLKKAGDSDAITDTIHYAKVTKMAVEVMQSEKNDLIERAATRVAHAILRGFPVEEVTVMLKKPHAPVAADFECMAVEITRCRSDLT